MKFLRLCQFNRRLSLFTQTLQNAKNELISFLFLFSILFFSFVCLFYLLFLSKMSSTSTLLSAVQMLFEMTLLKFKARELTEAAAFLGPFTFSLFIIFIVFISMNMFVTIINDHFRRARHKTKNDPEIFSFMLKRFLRWTGLKKAGELEMAIERDERMRSEYLHPWDALPLKIHQLSEAVDRIYGHRRLTDRERAV